MLTIHEYRGFAHGNGYVVRPSQEDGYTTVLAHRCPSRIGGAGSGEGGEEPVFLTVVTGVYHSDGVQQTIPFAVVEADPSARDTWPAEALIQAYKHGCVGATDGCVLALAMTAAGEEPPRVVTLGLSDYIDPIVLAELIAAASGIALDWLSRRYPKDPPKTDAAAMDEAWGEAPAAGDDRPAGPTAITADGVRPLAEVEARLAEVEARIADLDAEAVAIGRQRPEHGAAAERFRLAGERDALRVSIQHAATAGN